MRRATVDRVIRKCLAKDPDDRWQSARDLKPALELIDLDAPARLGERKLQVPSPAISRSPAVDLAGSCRGGLLWSRAAGRGAVACPGTRARARVSKSRCRRDGDQSSQLRSVAPNGNKLAFTSRRLIKAASGYRDLDAVEARLLPGTAGAVSPIWSPDSRSLAFSALAPIDERRSLRGPPQVLGESATPVGSGFWTEKGEIVFGGRGRGPMQKVSQAGGVPTAVTALAEAGVIPLRCRLCCRTDGTSSTCAQAPAAMLSCRLTGCQPEGTTASEGRADAVRVMFVRSGSSSTGNLFFLRDRTLMAQPFDPGKIELRGEPVPVAEHVGTESDGYFSVSPSGVLAYRTGATVTAGLQHTWFDREGNATGTFGEPNNDGGVKFRRTGRAPRYETLTSRREAIFGCWILREGPHSPYLPPKFRFVPGMVSGWQPYCVFGWRLSGHDLREIRKRSRRRKGTTEETG